MAYLATVERAEKVAQALTHLSMFGSAAYSVRKLGSRWVCDPFFGMNVSPLAYKTKREAIAQFETFYASLRDQYAGRQA